MSKITVLDYKQNNKIYLHDKSTDKSNGAYGIIANGNSSFLFSRCHIYSGTLILSCGKYIIKRPYKILTNIRYVCDDKK